MPLLGVVHHHHLAYGDVGCHPEAASTDEASLAPLNRPACRAAATASRQCTSWLL